jgi:Sugar (and other) transporter
LSHSCPCHEGCVCRSNLHDRCSVLSDKLLGRKLIQCLGFALMTLAYGLIALAPALSTLTLPFLLVYGTSYFFTEFGPNVTTFVYPAEVFPVMIRTTGHGIAAALGKCGAFLGAFIFPSCSAPSTSRAPWASLRLSLPWACCSASSFSPSRNSARWRRSRTNMRCSTRRRNAFRQCLSRARKRNQTKSTLGVQCWRSLRCASTLALSPLKARQPCFHMGDKYQCHTKLHCKINSRDVVLYHMNSSIQISAAAQRSSSSDPCYNRLHLLREGEMRWQEPH